MITVVTGASGHVGNNLVRSLLAEGRQVRVVLHHNTSPFDGLIVEKIRGDICDADSLSAAFTGADVVYHLAARVSIEMSGWKTLHAINTTGARNVADACLKHGVRRMIHFSSIDAIEQKPVDIPVDEKSPPAHGQKHPPYNRSKAAGEAAVRAVVERGLDAVILNPTAIIGPHDFQPSHQGQMLLSMAHGSLPALVKGGFDWIDVRDVVYGAMQAEKLAPRGSKYILGGHWASLAEIARMVERNTGVPSPGFTCPLWLASAGAPLVTTFEHLRGRRPLYTRASIIAINSNRHISHEKAEKELDYHPRPLEQTIRDTLTWFANCGQLPEKSR
ncbi:MAG: NAD-dependent epimerase/dehydratase family protein [Dehalococcoidia bacterium]|nr:MAG: NAD-dependent epimerase/dehydratase family protein [Dehalococcoidia bacterium]